MPLFLIYVYLNEFMVGDKYKRYYLGYHIPLGSVNQERIHLCPTGITPRISFLD